MSMLRTSLCSLAILAAGTGLFATATQGFQSYTSEGLLRLSVRQAPRPIPGIMLQTATGGLSRLTGQHGQWLIVGFMYTRCATVCSLQGSGFAQLQALLQTPIAQGQVSLLSISLDPERDTPSALMRYQQRHSETGDGWLVTRPQSQADLQTLMDTFGVKAIPDGLGGLDHNAAFNLIGPTGMLVNILDWDDPQAVANYVLARLSS